MGRATAIAGDLGKTKWEIPRDFDIRSKAICDMCQSNWATPRCGRPEPPLIGPQRSVRGHHPESADHCKEWRSITANPRATPNGVHPSPQLKELQCGMGVHKANSTNHNRRLLVHHRISRVCTQAWESMHQNDGPHGIVAVHNLGSRGRPPGRKVGNPTRGATPKHASPSRTLQGLKRSVGVHKPKSRGHTEAW